MPRYDALRSNFIFRGPGDWASPRRWSLFGYSTAKTASPFGKTGFGRRGCTEGRGGHLGIRRTGAARETVGPALHGFGRAVPLRVSVHGPTRDFTTETRRTRRKGEKNRSECTDWNSHLLPFLSVLRVSVVDPRCRVNGDRCRRARRPSHCFQFPDSSNSIS
jgi:hypothetical protein